MWYSAARACRAAVFIGQPRGRRARRRYGSSLDRHVQCSVNFQDLDLDPFAGSLEPQIGARLADSEAPNLDVVNVFGKDWADDTQAVFVAFRLKPQQGREHI